MIKKRVVTITITALLLIAALILGIMHSKNIIYFNVLFSEVMLVATAIYVLGGCMLQTFGHIKLSIALGVLIFGVLCTGLFYSISALDYIIFGVCIYLLIRRQSTTCEWYRHNESIEAQ